MWPNRSRPESQPDLRGDQRDTPVASWKIEDVADQYFPENYTPAGKKKGSEKRKLKKERLANAEALKSLFEVHGEKIVSAEAELVHERMLAILKNLKYPLHRDIEDKRWVFLYFAQQKQLADKASPKHRHKAGRGQQENIIGNPKKLQEIVDQQIGRQCYRNKYKHLKSRPLKRLFEMRRGHASIAKRLDDAYRNHNIAEELAAAAQMGAVMRGFLEKETKKSYKISEEDIKAAHAAVEGKDTGEETGEPADDEGTLDDRRQPSGVGKKKGKKKPTKDTTTPEPENPEKKKEKGWVWRWFTGRKNEQEQEIKEKLGKRVGKWLLEKFKKFDKWREKHPALAFLGGAALISGALALSGWTTIPLFIAIGVRSTIHGLGAYFAMESFLRTRRPKKERIWHKHPRTFAALAGFAAFGVTAWLGAEATHGVTAVHQLGAQALQHGTQHGAESIAGATAQHTAQAATHQGTQHGLHHVGHHIGHHVARATLGTGVHHTGPSLSEEFVRGLTRQQLRTLPETVQTQLLNEWQLIDGGIHAGTVPPDYFFIGPPA